MSQRPISDFTRCLRAGCSNQINRSKYLDVCVSCADEARRTGCSWEDLPNKDTGERFIRKSELGKGIESIKKWFDEGMKPKSNIAFTEGDLRIVAELIEYVILKNKQCDENELPNNGTNR